MFLCLILLLQHEFRVTQSLTCPCCPLCCVPPPPSLHPIPSPPPLTTGEDMRKLDAGVHVVSGTPGRVKDMMERQKLRTRHIKVGNCLCVCFVGGGVSVSDSVCG